MRSISSRAWLALTLFWIMACHPTNTSRLDEAWDAANNPVLMMAYGNEFVTKFGDLPLKGQPDKMPWSDNYWPSYEGGIAYRWNWSRSKDLARELLGSSDREFAGQLDDAPELQKLRSEVLGYRPYTKEELQALPDDLRSTTIATLSPAEKYDIYRGRFDYPTVAFERRRTGINATLRDQAGYTPGFKIHKWFGICHAWAPATILFEEPGSLEVDSKDGFRIPMAASDVKALLSHMLDKDPGQAHASSFLAERCNNDISNKSIGALYSMAMSLQIAQPDLLQQKLVELDATEAVDRQTKLVIASYFYAFAADPATAAAGYASFFERYKNAVNSFEQKVLTAAYEDSLKNIAAAGTAAATAPDVIKEGIIKAVRKPACNDTNAGAFHLVLANIVGLQHASFGIDITRDAEVWNQSVASFESTAVDQFEGDAISPDAAPGTVKELEIRTRFRYTTEMAPAWEPFGDDRNLKSYHVYAGDTYLVEDQYLKALAYKIELDRDDRIIGGSWLSDVRPDFLWGTGTPVFSKEFEDLEDLYYQALENRHRHR